MNHVISVEQVFRQYGNKIILSNISLQIPPAQIFGLLGPSGSGKSTLVKLIAGIDIPSTGTIHIWGQRMPQFAMMAKIGYMAQSDALYPELTANENLQFFGALFGLHGKRLKKRIGEVMELVNLSMVLNKQVSSFSGGMKRRLSLAIALLHEPTLLILDEPTVGIDPVLRKSIWQELEKLRREGTTLLVTTHVMDEADKCNRLGMIREGELIAVGTPDELKEHTGSTSIEEAFLYYGGVKA